jgi:TonB family protein
VKEKRIRNIPQLSGRVFLILSFVVTTFAASVYAQSPPEPEPIQHRIARARAMAAAHNLTAATFELDAILSSTKDDTVRDVARVMLMGIYLEQADYGRAQNLLDETYKGRSAQNESSVRSYFAMAGQSVNGARAHLERYRAFGIDIAAKDLPPEATTDLDRLRTLLERIATQAREMSDEDARNTDAAALLEDVASIRGTLARNSEERQQWKREFANARQKLAASDTRTASMRGISNHPGTGTMAVNPVAAVSTESAPATSKASRSGNPTKGSGSSASRDAAPSDSSQNAAQNGQLMEVGSLVDKATQKVSPTYPQIARTQRVSGVVKVYLVVDETGSVAAIQRSSGPPLLLQAATEAARRWKFQPTLMDGQPVRVAGYINFNFIL